MRIIAIVLCVGLLAAAPALAQTGGHIGLYVDNPGFSDYCLTENLYVTNSVYAVHHLLPEANTSQFMVANNWPGVIVGAVTYFANLNLGDIYTGVTITYVGCKPLPHLLAQMDFIPVSATPPCTASLEVVPDPALASGQIEVVDCSSNVLFATGGIVWINPDVVNCPCFFDATETTTWGRIKAQYQ